MTNKQNTNPTPGTPPALPEELPRLLLAWYDQHARALPWRENAEPYRVWVSEIMLQQTNVATVGPYYERFLEAFPTVGALASADEQKVLKLWEGLGYYARARNLKKAAGIVVRDYGGRFPDTYDDIRKLPGIGPYTAGALASICFDAPVPAVDGNAERVVSRLAGLYTADRTMLKKQVTSLLSGIYPAARRGDFTQSLMELGALVCVPNGSAKCDSCPVSGRCAAYAAGTVSSLPVRRKRPERKRDEITVLLLSCRGTLALLQRSEGGLLPGLWEFPNVPGHLRESETLELVSLWGARPSAVTGVARRKHIFTHVEWDMLCYAVECAERPPGFTWADRRALSGRYPLPTAFRKLLKD